MTPIEPHDPPGAETNEATTPGGVSKERVAGLFDGIVAITATLLVIDLGVSAEGGTLTFSDLAAAMGGILHWLVSFVMVAVIWREFHYMFAHTQRWDGGLLAMTFAQFGAISLIPFATGLVGDHPRSMVAALVFAVIMGLNGLLVSANLLLLRAKDHLHMGRGARHHLGHHVRRQVSVFAAGIAVSIAAAWLHDPLLGIAAWALCPLVIGLGAQPPSAGSRADRAVA